MEQLLGHDRVRRQSGFPTFIMTWRHYVRTSVTRYRCGDNPIIVFSSRTPRRGAFKLHSRTPHILGVSPAKAVFFFSPDLKQLAYYDVSGPTIAIQMSSGVSQLSPAGISELNELLVCLKTVRSRIVSTE